MQALSELRTRRETAIRWYALAYIAGIVLGIGLAVDANVLINERIREETLKGKAAVSAIDAGFRRAYATVMDSNVTALIATLLLFWFGSGPVRGFAIFRGLGQPGGIVELFRIALNQAGGGRGDAFFRALVDFAFNDAAAQRLWLDASAENPRAIKVYTRAGFRLEGTLRHHWFRPALGRAVDLILMGVLRSEWETLERLPPRP